MATQSLLNSQVESGVATIKALDLASLGVGAAFWLFDEETQTWRFNLVERGFDSAGPRSTYDRISAALAKAPGTLPFREVYLVSPKDPLIQRMKLALSTPPNAILGVWFMGNSVNGVVLPDMYVYRIS